jgi:hypothetical protein
VFQALLFVGAAAAIPPDLGNWQTLEDGAVQVSHTTAAGLPWARCVTVLPGSMAQLVNLLKDFRAYPTFMDRISETRIYEEDVVHLILDMPFPLASRDYVVKYTRGQDGDAVIFDFVAVSHPSATAVEGSVRLPRAEGQWRLEPVGTNKTRVTYIWNGELLGDFPDWALTKAWVTQGEEVMGWLGDAL